MTSVQPGAAPLASLLEGVDLSPCDDVDGLPLGTYTSEELLAVSGPDGGALPVGDRPEVPEAARDAVLDASVRSLVARGGLIASPDGNLAAAGPLGIVLAARQHSHHLVVAERHGVAVDDVTAFYLVDAGRPLVLEERRTEGAFHVMTLWAPETLFDDLGHRWGLYRDGAGQEGDTPDVVRAELDADRLPSGDAEGVESLREDLGSLTASVALFASRPAEGNGSATPPEASIAFVDSVSGRRWALIETTGDAPVVAAHRLRSLDHLALLDACFRIELDDYR